MKPADLGKPRLRGRLHQYAFFVALVCGVVLCSIALSRPGARFIMEVKRGSPSGGAIRPAADAGALARAYRGAADAISVLTDAPYFGGSLEDLRASLEDGRVHAAGTFKEVRARSHAFERLVRLGSLDD